MPNAPKLYAEEPAWFKGLVALLTPPRKAVRLVATPPLPRRESDIDGPVVAIVHTNDTRSEADSRDVLSRTARALGGELCDLILEIIALVMWRGVAGCDNWKVDSLTGCHSLVV